MTDDISPTDRDALAGELALGLLEGPERARALRLCLNDPAFAAEVERWQAQLAPMLDSMPEVQPADHVWNAVQARIGSGTLGSMRQRLRQWQAASIALGAVAAGLALLLLAQPKADITPAKIGVAQLAGAQGVSAIAVAFDPARGVLRLAASAPKTGGKGPEMWVIPSDGTPRSLGIVQADGGEIRIDDKLRPFLSEGATLAITMEDIASAPHKAPSSKPILAGKISIL